MGSEQLQWYQNPPFFPRSQKEESRGAIIGVLGQELIIYVYIRPKAQAED